MSEVDRPPSPDEIRADMEMAAQLVAMAVLGGIAVTGGPGGVFASVTLSPLALSIASKVAAKLSDRRIRNAADTVLHAASAAKLSPDDFLDKAVADDQRHELLARTLVVAQDTAVRDKRRALGRALAAGVMGDDARIDEELLFVAAIADLNEMHIRLLDRMKDETQPPGMSAMRIRQEDPGLGDGVYALFGTLETHGLIVRRMPGTRMSGPEQSYYYITALGQKFLRRLADDAD